jgi:protein-S-isoprenylcysteine O-methyltransferase Ste14
LFLALGLIAANWFILLCAVMAFIEIRAAVIRREERELQARLGASHDQHISRTGALWPRHLRRSGG